MWFRLILAKENIGVLTSSSHTRDSVPKLVCKIHILPPHYVILCFRVTVMFTFTQFARPGNWFYASTPLCLHTEDIHVLEYFRGPGL